MARDLIIVRTYKADPPSLAAYDLYAGLADFDVVFCVDERAAVADMGGRDKVAFDNARLMELELYPHPDCGWQCGDYFYHVARAARPDYAFYWLIEPDVTINVEDLSGFFRMFAENAADLLAPRLTFNDHSWSWTKEIAATGLPPWRCFFPLTRLSGRAIDHVHRTRKSHSADPRIAGAKTWPNDEGITASALAAGDFTCQDLNGGEIMCYSGASLNGVALIDPDVLANRPPDGMIYHPVRSFAHWFAASLAKMVEIERDPEPETGYGRICGRALNLTRIGQTCLRNPGYEDASLMPLVLGAHLWSIRPPGHNMTEFTRNFHARAERLNAGRLAERFGAAASRRQVGSAHAVLARPGAIRAAPVAASDFGLGAPVALGRLPRAAALPYAWDLAAGELLMSAHLSVDPVLAEPHLPQAQRQMARVILRVPQDRLARAYAPRPDDPPLLIGLAQDEEAAERLAETLRARGVPTACLPGALAQIQGAPALPGDALGPPVLASMVRASLAPLLHVACTSGPDDRRAAVLLMPPARFLAILTRAFPSARYVVVRDTPLPPALAVPGAVVLAARDLGKEELLF